MAETRSPHRLRLLTRFARDDRGAVAVEYAVLIIMVCIALVGMASLSGIADKQNTVYNDLSQAISGQ